WRRLDPRAKASCHRLRHGLSRSRKRPATGLRAWHARRLPHLVGGDGAAVEKFSRDRGQPAALLSRTLGRYRRRLPDEPAYRRRDRFIEQIEPKPVNLMGHSRGGHIAYRVAEARPELLQKLVLAEPGGDLDATLAPPAAPAIPSAILSRIMASAEKVKSGDVEGALQNFFDGIDGEGAWARLGAAAKQQLRDNVFTLIGQVRESRKPYSKASAQSIKTPTLFIGGAETTGLLPAITRALAAEIPGARTAMIAAARHWMFEQAPQEYCRT